VLGLTAVGTVVDQVQNGANLMAAITAIAVQAGPALVMELIHAVFGGWGDGGAGKAALKSMFPPAMCLMLCLGIAGCAGGAKDVVKVGCEIVKAADDGLCPYVDVVFPDGTHEKVPRSAIAGLALDRMAARLRGEVDGGK
jgi:hypothetical protein